MRPFHFLVAAVISLAVAGCAAREANTDPLAGSRWRIIALDGAPVDTVAQPAPTLEIEPEQIGGDTGVNRYSGAATIANDHLRIGALISTRRAGPQAAMERERILLLALGAVRTWNLADGRLRLMDGDGAIRLVGERMVPDGGNPYRR